MVEGQLPIPELVATRRAAQIQGARVECQNAMGHSDVKTAMTYQHPELNVVREAINARQISGHVLGHRSDTTGRVN